MNKKSLKLIWILIIAHILLTVIIMVIPNSWDISGDNMHVKAVEPFLFLFSLVLPIILLTQFRHKVFYRNFAFFVILIRIFGLITTFSIGGSINNSFIIAVQGVVIILGYLGFAYYAFNKEGLTKMGIYLLLAGFNLIYSKVAIVFSDRFMIDSIAFKIIMFLMPLALFYTGFVYLLIQINAECIELDLRVDKKVDELI